MRPILKKGNKGQGVFDAQTLLNLHGANPELKMDGDFGLKTEAAVKEFQKRKSITADGIIGPLTWALLVEKPGQAPAPQTPSQGSKTPPPWYLYARKFLGKKETDPDFNKWMSSKWPLVGLDLKTIATSWAAWCGLAMAVALSGVGIDYQRNGALAKNWDKYGVEINWRVDGIPQGAVVRINHGQSCNSGSGNHVAQANGDCTAKDLLKPGALINLYGGNQGNTWKVSTFKAATVCAVRWPKDVKDYPKPGPVTVSKNCSSGDYSGDSTQ